MTDINIKKKYIKKINSILDTLKTGFCLDEYISNQGLSLESVNKNCAVFINKSNFSSLYKSKEYKTYISELKQIHKNMMKTSDLGKLNELNIMAENKLKEFLDFINNLRLQELNIIALRKIYKLQKPQISLINGIKKYGL